MAKEQVVEELAEPTQAKPKKSKGRFVIGGVILGVMLAEGLVIFVLVKSFGGADPQAANAAGISGLDADGGQKASEKAEVEIVSIRATNEKSQPRTIYQLSIFAVVPSEHKEAFEKVVAGRTETIKDRFTRIIRAADPNSFTEPDLATIRKQFEYELNQIVGIEGAVDEVLISSIVPYTDY